MPLSRANPAAYSAAADWLRVYAPDGFAPIRLVCFPHAGGSAPFYRTWAAQVRRVAEIVCVQYPGRADRIGDPFTTSLQEMADNIALALTAEQTRPLALFGHSFGAAVAAEVATRIHPERLLHLFVSGRTQPASPGTTHLSSDDALWAATLDLGGTPAILAESNTLRSMALPALRSDYTLSETYEPAGSMTFACPVSAVTGADDDDAPAGELENWRPYCAGGFEQTVFPGGHFYLSENPEPLLDFVMQRVVAAAPAAHRGADPAVGRR